MVLRSSISLCRSLSTTTKQKEKKMKKMEMMEKKDLRTDRLPFSSLLIAIAIAIAIVGVLSSHVSCLALEKISRDEILELREEVREMFYHAYNGYMDHAFPLDELRPLSCKGEDTLGGYSLTIIDAMDTLALLGNKSEFAKAVRWASANLNFDRDITVSVFETNIRVLGGLLSAHLLASDPATGMQVEGYKDELLHLAEDLGSRMLPAFDTPTGIPYGSVNLRKGVHADETKVTSTAGGGTLALEFGMLSRLTGNPVFEEAAKNAVRGLWAQRSSLGLVGGHINVFTGEWTHKDAGIGTSIDSFYEYLLKAHLLLGDDEYLHMFNQAYKAAMRFLHQDPWYVEVNMNSALLVWPLFNSLQAFWPGLQVLVGDLEPAVRTHKAFYGVWRKFGFTPEGYNLGRGAVQPGQRSYPLRPELAESTYWLYRATNDQLYLHVGRDMVASLQNLARCNCGFCHIANVETHEQDDHMESFFLSETVKYLWLLFDSAVGGNDFVANGPHPYIFTTEGHLFPIRPEYSLRSEHCTYPGSPCKVGLKGQAAKKATEGQHLDHDVGRTGKGSWSAASRQDDSQAKEQEEWEVARSRGRQAAQSLAGLCPKPSFWRKIALQGPTDGAALMNTLSQRQSDRADARIIRLINMVTSKVAQEGGDSRGVAAGGRSEGDVNVKDCGGAPCKKGAKRRKGPLRVKIVEPEKVFGGASAAVIQLVVKEEQRDAKNETKADSEGSSWSCFLMSIALPGLIWMFLGRSKKGEKEEEHALTIKGSRVAPELLYLTTVHEGDEENTEEGSTEEGSGEESTTTTEEGSTEEESTCGSSAHSSREAMVTEKQKAIVVGERKPVEMENEENRQEMESLDPPIRLELVENMEEELRKEEGKEEDEEKEDVREVAVVSNGDVKVVNVKLVSKSLVLSPAAFPSQSGKIMDTVLREEDEVKNRIQNGGDFLSTGACQGGYSTSGGEEVCQKKELQDRIALEDQLASAMTLQALSKQQMQSGNHVGKERDDDSFVKVGRGASPRVIPGHPDSGSEEDRRAAEDEGGRTIRRDGSGSGSQVIDVGVVEGSPAVPTASVGDKTAPVVEPKSAGDMHCDAEAEKNRSWWGRGRSRDFMRRLKWFRRDSVTEIEWEEDSGRKWKGEESGSWFGWALRGKAGTSETGPRMTRRLSSKLWSRIFGAQKAESEETYPETESDVGRGWVRGKVARLWSVIRRDKARQARLTWNDSKEVPESGELESRSDPKGRQPHTTGKVGDDEGKESEQFGDAHGKNGLWQFGKKSSKKKVDVVGIEGPWGVDGGVAGCGGFMCMPVRTRKGSRQLDFRG
ncbi:hypothetical protein CBR_g23002 [Chara braunii]|uniref:alpha-1,2-Mannosidase n=1 Tax=Chara braunii TaxID=69332 RepID=A0A388L3B3_CHABU|nr:hypothetical protein CBR_g23002 [Chara braunii]|eukprot:GBG76786.1 hypothetical protein CBR_g23002 [Chara braunii]